jgi:hypothetical protein
MLLDTHGTFMKSDHILNANKLQNKNFLLTTFLHNDEIKLTINVIHRSSLNIAPYFKKTQSTFLMT